MRSLGGVGLDDGSVQPPFSDGRVVAKRSHNGRVSPHQPRAVDQIARLKINDFKSLKDVEVELGQVNVLIGANGAGKSNLLEAIGILGAAASGRVDDQALLRRGVRPGVPELYKSAFVGGKLSNFVKLAATSTTATACAC